MSGIDSPALLITSDFLVDRLAGLDIPAKVLGPAMARAELPPEVAARVTAIACAGELPNALVDALPALRLVACFSTGYEGIDVEHLRDRGIALTTGGGVNAHDVADHAIALFLSVWHATPGNDRLVRSGGWRQGLSPRHSLRGRHAGIVGFGRIGQAIADRLVAHQMQVAWWGPREKPGTAFPRSASLVELARQSDALFVASRSSAENAGQIDATILHALGSNGVLVNVSRGLLVDEPALIDALRAGALGGAGLDVFVDEPADPERWRDVPGAVLSPHVAGFTAEGGADLVAQLRANIEHFFRGEPLLTPVA